MVRETRDWNIGAYELYLQARQLVVARRDSDEALELINAAIKLEPEFSDAWAEKATALAIMAFDLGKRDETIDQSHATYDEAWLAARRATEIQPGHPLGLAVQGLIRMNQKRWIEARVFYERALGVDKPSDYAFLWLGILQFLTGDSDGALATFDAGLDLSPTAPNLIRWRGRVLSHQGDWDAIWAQWSEPSAVIMRDTTWTQQLAGLHLGELTVEQLVPWLEEEDAAFDGQQRVLAFGDSEPIITILNFAFNQNASEPNPSIKNIFLAQDFTTQYKMMDVQPELMVNYFKGREDSVLKAPNRNDLGTLWIAEVSPYRQSAAFMNLVTELGLPAYWDLYGWPAMCRPTSASDFACD